MYNPVSVELKNITESTFNSDMISSIDAKFGGGAYCVAHIGRSVCRSICRCVLCNG